MRMKKSNLKMITAAIAVIILGATLSFAGTVAGLKAKAQAENTFTVANVDCRAMEDQCIKDPAGDILRKKNVTIKNIGDISAYIRVALVVNYTDSSGEIKALQPEKDIDYTLDINEEDWFLGDDGYYYCKTAVMADECTPVLINESRAISSLEGYKLEMTIISSAIQSKPQRAVESAWSHIKVNDGQLEKR